MRIFFAIILCLSSLPGVSQKVAEKETSYDKGKLIFGFQTGAGWAYEDEKHLFHTSVYLTADYGIGTKLFVQFAPQYSILWKWKEHYLTFPIHLRKQFASRLSLYAGPALIFDVGFFKDLGVSGGAYYNLSEKSALAISAYTFTLYDYDIDFLYIPVTISYRFKF
ncbi:MAG: hypothetical protein KDC80_19080 [Saprospiraceae bacterium]|nr:hypothetical protein [Saprospiraceae bacterium]